MRELTIVSFNAHVGVRPRPIALPRLRARQARRGRGAFDVAAVLEGFAADVVVVQEAFHPYVGPCAAELAAAHLGAEAHEVSFGRASNDPWRSHRGVYNGTVGLAVVTRYPASDTAELPVGRVPGDPARNRRALRLALDVDGEPLELIAVHLTSRLPYGPPYQLRRLAAQLPPPGQRAVLVGDLNFWGPAATRLLPGWRRAVRGRTWPAHRPHSQIDHVLVRDDVEVVDGAILGDVGSDHLPVWVRLRVGGNDRGGAA